jgi:hypothetical protein
MPMVVAQLKADLTSDLQAIFADLDPEATAASKAQAIADVIASRVDAYLRTATVTTTVTGTSTDVTACPAGAGTGTGTVTGAGTGSLS